MTAALGAGAGNSVEIEHAVRGLKKITRGYQWMTELERERDGARVCSTLFYLYPTHYCTGEEESGETEERDKRTCVCVVCNGEMNDL